MCAIQETLSPVGFVLRIKNPNTIVLGIHTLDLSKLELLTIDLSNVVYSVYNVQENSDTKNKILLLEDWMGKLLELDFEEKAIVQEQFKLSRFSFEKHHSYFYACFTHTLKTPPLSKEQGAAICVSAFQAHSAPVDLILHVKDYYIKELEVYTVDGSALNIHDVDLSNLTCR